MFRKFLVMVMVVLFVGCAQLKDRFGTPEETAELKKDRAYCQSVAEESVANSQSNAIKRSDEKRNAYRACMKNKGYDSKDRKTQ